MVAINTMALSYLPNDSNPHPTAVPILPTDALTKLSIKFVSKEITVICFERSFDAWHYRAGSGTFDAFELSISEIFFMITPPTLENYSFNQSNHRLETSRIEASVFGLKITIYGIFFLNSFINL